MAQFCTECGAAVEPGKKFCISCGARIEAAPVNQAPAPVQPAPVTQAAQPVQAAPPAPGNQAVQERERDGPPYARTGYPDNAPGKMPGMLWYLRHLLLMSIPLAGLALSVVWGVRPPPDSRRNLARAMIFVNIIWLAIAALFAAWEFSLLSRIAEVAQVSFKFFGFELFK